MINDSISHPGIGFGGPYFTSTITEYELVVSLIGTLSYWSGHPKAACAISDDTVSSVYSHQKKISFVNLTKDANDYASFTFQVDLSDVYWELVCKIRFSSDSTDAKPVLDIVILSGGDEESEEWKLPYSTPLNYK